MSDTDKADRSEGQHIQRLANGNWRYRRKVPLDLREQMGKTEIIVSLKTDKHAVAVIAGAAIDQQVEEEFERQRQEIRATSLDRLTQEAREVTEDALGRLGFGKRNSKRT